MRSSSYQLKEILWVGHFFDGKNPTKRRGCVLTIEQWPKKSWDQKLLDIVLGRKGPKHAPNPGGEYHVYTPKGGTIQVIYRFDLMTSPTPQPIFTLDENFQWWQRPSRCQALGEQDRHALLEKVETWAPLKKDPAMNEWHLMCDFVVFFYNIPSRKWRNSPRYFNRKCISF